MPLTRGRPAGPVSPSLQLAVESLTPTSAAELAHAARQRTEQDALKTLALFLDEPATAESVVMVRSCPPSQALVLFSAFCTPADSRPVSSDTQPQLVINRAEVEGRCDPRSPVVATAATLLARLLSSLQPPPGQTALDAVLKCCDTILACRLPATSSQGGAAAGVQATVRTVQHLRRVAATLLASTSATPTRGPAASPTDAPPPPEASPARRSRRSLSLGSAAAAAAAARAAWLQEAPALDVPSDVFAWRWGGDARLAQMLPPPARSLRCAPGCSLSLGAWLLGSDVGGDGGGSRGGGGGHAGVADAATAARHVAQIEADRAARRATLSRAQQQQQQQQQQQYDTYGNVSVSSGGDGTEAMYGAGTSTRGGSEAALSGATTEAMWQPAGTTQSRGQGGLRAGWASPQMGGQYSRHRGLSRGFLGAYTAARKPPVKLSPGDVSAVVQVVSAGQAPHVAAGLSGGSGAQASLRRSASGSFLSRLTGAVAVPPHSGASIRKFSGGSGVPGIQVTCADVAGGMLVRLVWDQFAQSGPEGATTAVAPLLRSMLASPRPRGRCAAFDLLLTCAAHVPWSGALDVGPDESGDDATQRVRHASAHVTACHAWLRTLCADCMLALAASGEGHSLVWHSATSVLLILSARNGRLVLPYISAACPLPAMRALVDAAMAHGWNRELVGALLRALAAMLYDPDPTWHGDTAAAGSPAGADKALRRASSDGAGFGGSGGPKHMFVRDRVTLVGGTPWLVRMLAAAPPCRLTRGALMAPLLDVAMAAAEAMGGGGVGDNTGFHALLAAALHLSGGADAVTFAALGGHSGVAAALADGLCACWPVETSPGGCLEATGAHNAVPPVFIALEALCTSACALPPQLTPWAPGACASAVRGEDVEGTGKAGPLWAPFVDLLKSPHAGERRDGAAWLVLALRDAALVATASHRLSTSGGGGNSAVDADGARSARGGGQPRDAVSGADASEPYDESGGDRGDGVGPSGSSPDELDAPSVLPDPDTPLGMLLGDCVIPEPPPCGPPWVRSLVEKALLHSLLSCQPFSAPSGAGGAAIGAWALATLEDAALRLATHGGQGAAVEATEMIVGALAVYPDDTGDDLWAASSTSGGRRQAPRRGDAAAPGQRAAATWHSHCACFLSGGCTMPVALLRRMRLDTLLALFTALAPLPVTAEEQQQRGEEGGGATAVLSAWLAEDPSRMGLTSRPRCSPASDARAAVALLLLARCAGCEPELEELGGEATVRGLTQDADARVAYAAACFLLARLARAAPGAYRAGLRRLVLHAQGADDERFLDNPHFRFMALAMY